MAAAIRSSGLKATSSRCGRICSVTGMTSCAPSSDTPPLAESGARRPLSSSTTIAGSAVSRSIGSGCGVTRSKPGSISSKAGATNSSRNEKPGWTAALELVEGRAIVEAILPQAPPAMRSGSGKSLRAFDAGDTARRGELMLSAELRDVMARSPLRGDALRYPRELEIVVDRRAARFAAWYEMFPRSQGKAAGPERHLRRLHRPASRDRATWFRRRLPVADPSDRPREPQGQGQQPGRAARRSGQSLCDRFDRWRPSRGQPGTRNAGGFSPICSSCGRARHRGGARLRSPMRPRSPVGARASAMVSIPSRRHDQIRREPAKEIRGHRQCRLSEPRSRGIVERTARHGHVLDRARACAFFASTIRTPSRCRFGNG